MMRALLDTLQRALNRDVGESTAATSLAREIEGSSLAVDVEGTGLSFSLTATDGSIVIEQLDCTAAETPTSSTVAERRGSTPAGAASSGDLRTATLRATPLELLALLAANGARSPRTARAALSGDLRVVEDFARLLQSARPDLEDELSGWIGDVAAHGIGQLARGFGGWLQRAARALEMNTSEYLQEESRVLPAALEARSFYAEVERLRGDVETLARRLERLARRLERLAVSAAGAR